VSAENVKVVQELYQAMDDRDLEAVEVLTDADLEWVSDPRLGLAPVRGREKVIRFFLDQDEIFDDLRPARALGRGRGSGAEVEIRIGHLWTLRDGLLVRGEGYGDRAEALVASKCP
jgi:ketosteroid isomerase-like protein